MNLLEEIEITFIERVHHKSQLTVFQFLLKYILIILLQVLCVCVCV